MSELLSTRNALAKVIWEASRADEGTISATGANTVADAILASGVVTDVSTLTDELRAMRPSTDVNRLSLSQKHREDELGRLAYRRAINDALDRITAVLSERTQ